MQIIYRPIKVGETIKVPRHQLDGIFDFYGENPSFKRRDALAVFFMTNSSAFIQSISTIKQIKDNTVICAVEFDRGLNEHELIHRILSKIELGSIHEIKFRITEIQKEIGLIRKIKKETQDIQISIQTNIFNLQQKILESEQELEPKLEKELNRITNHFGNLIDKKNTKEEINATIDLFRTDSQNPITYSSLVKSYEKILLWCRKEKRYLLNIDLREEMFDKLIKGNKELREWLGHGNPLTYKEYCQNKNYYSEHLDAIDLKSYISHAMFIANKIKCSKHVSNRENKRKNAKQMWLQYIIRKSKKKSKKSQREIAEEVGVSLGTLNSWFKEFNQFK